MASPDILDFETLLAPIPGDKPTGRPLREDFSPTAVYHQIKDARAAARAAERSLVWDEEGSEGAAEPPDWKPVLKLGPQVLAEESKDLEVAAWLTEALLREHGYAGLRDGFRLIRELVERFWDDLYPLPDEDGVLTRVAPLTGLNGEDSDGVLIVPIANVPITGEASYRGFTASDYQQALELDRLDDPDKRSQRIEHGAVSTQMFDKAVMETPPEFFRNVFEDLGRCGEEFEQLCRALEERCGKDEDGYPLAPPSSNIRNALQHARETLTSIARHLLEEPGAGAGGESAMVPVEGQAGATDSRVQSREQAFRALLQVAEFFKRTEPHSPVSYALEQAVRWGKMPLPDLLGELIPDESAREQLFKLVGIQPLRGEGED